MFFKFPVTNVYHNIYMCHNNVYVNICNPNQEQSLRIKVGIGSRKKMKEGGKKDRKGKHQEIFPNPN